MNDVRMSTVAKFSRLDHHLQNVSVFVFILLYMTVGPTGILLLGYLLSTQFYWLALLYIAHRIRDRHVADRGGRSSRWFRTLPWWKYCRDYFPVKVIKTAELDPEKHYILCSFPHGIFSIGTILGFCNYYKELEEMFPGIRVTGTTLPVFLGMPIAREYLLSMGGASTSKESLKYLLNDPLKGNALGIAVGGAAESLKSRPGSNELVLKNRKGFIKVALQNGASLVPVYVFGETDLYEHWPNPPGSWLRWAQDLFRNVTGIAPVVPRGSGFLGLMPKRSPVHVVVGKPMDLEKVPEPTNNQINELHKKFIDNLTALFEEEKHKYLKNADKASLVIN